MYLENFFEQKNSRCVVFKSSTLNYYTHKRQPDCFLLNLLTTNNSINDNFLAEIEFTVVQESARLIGEFVFEIVNRWQCEILVQKLKNKNVIFCKKKESLSKISYGDRSWAKDMRLTLDEKKEF
ncbi:hypothetical protein BpHYR1_037952 [Brachionus plicatilis]|uniref:Uncharacterized protein n=1 Tax=Brachionus plicatilis TaxID=10195 RepID=A0A3M7QEJ0_BRAPC|nr:hypothetical protein BpHYR1_037952 [Brachionus plicatilis]